MGFLSQATGDPTQLRRRIAQQLVRGVPPAESLYRDFRSNGGPMTISQGEIKRAVIAVNGEPMADLTGKRNMGGGPFAVGDVDPSNQGFLQMLGNVLEHYDYSQDDPTNPTWARWRMSLRGADDFAPYLGILNDNDYLPRTRIHDTLIGGVQVAATPNGNYQATFPFVSGGYDFFGAPVQEEGGATGLSISSITRVGSVATATTAAPHGLASGDVVRISGATQAGYNGDVPVTVTGASTFTYTVDPATVTPSTGTRVFEKLNSTLPVLNNTFPGNWDADATDSDVWVELIAVSGSALTLQVKLGAAAAFWAADLDVTSITRSGSTATVTTASAHGLITGETVIVQGAVETQYNGSKSIVVTGSTTFTYTVAGSPATPATGTLTLKLVQVAATAGLDTASNPIYTRLVKQSGALLGKFSEQLRMHFPAGGTYRDGDVFRFPKRRATRWAQTLHPDRPISSVNTAIFLGGEEIRFEGGVQISIARANLTAVQDTPGVQGATVKRTGDLIATVTITRQITDLRLQKAIHEGAEMSIVVESKSDVLIGSSGRAYRALWIFPSCRAYGAMVDVPAGGGNTTEAPVLRAKVPELPFTYTDDGGDIVVDSHVAVVLENDIFEADVIAA